MTPTTETRVLVFTIDGAPDSDLLRIALGHCWTVRHPASASAAFEEIVRHHPLVVVVQVSGMLGEDLELIRLIHAGALPVSVVAVAVTHGEAIELAARAAGVDCYLGDSTDGTLIESTVSEILGRRERCDVPNARVRRRGPGEIDSLLLSSYVKGQSRAAGPLSPPPTSTTAEE